MKLKESENNYPISKLEKITNSGWKNLSIVAGLSVTFSFVGEHIMLIAIKGDLSKMEHTPYFELRKSVLKEFAVMYRLSDFVEIIDVQKATKISSKALHLFKCRDQVDDNAHVIKQVVYNFKKKNGIFSLFSQDTLVSKTRDLCENYDTAIRTAIHHLKENENYSSLKADKLISKEEWILKSNGSETVVKTIPNTLVYVQHKGFLVEPSVEEFIALQLNVFQNEKFKNTAYYRITDYRDMSGCSTGARQAYVTNLKELHKAFGSPEMEYIIGSDDNTKEAINNIRKDINWDFTYCDNYNDAIIELYNHQNQSCLTGTGKSVSISGKGTLTKDFITLEDWSHNEDSFAYNIQAIEDKVIYIKVSGELKSQGFDSILKTFDEVISHYFNTEALYLILDVSQLKKIKPDVRKKLDQTLKQFNDIYQKKCTAIYIHGASPTASIFINAIQHINNIKLTSVQSIGEALNKIETNVDEYKKTTGYSNMAYSQLVLDETPPGQPVFTSNPVLEKIFNTLWSPEKRDSEPLHKKNANFQVLNALELIRANSENPFIETSHQDNILLVKNTALENSIQIIEEMTRSAAIVRSGDQQQFILESCKKAKADISKTSQLLLESLESIQKNNEELLINHFIKEDLPDLSAINKAIDLSLIKKEGIQLSEWEINLKKLFDQFQEDLTEEAAKLDRSIQFNISKEIPAVLVGDPFRVQQILYITTQEILKTSKIGSPLITIEGLPKKKDFQLKLTIKEENNTLRKEDVASLFGITSSGYRLNLCRHLSEKMGGQLTIETPSPKELVLSCDLTLKPGTALNTQQGKMNPNSDVLQAFKLEGTDIRGDVVHLEQSHLDALKNEEYPEQIKLLIGQIMIAASLLSSVIQFKGRLRLQLRSTDISKLLVEVTDQKDIRAAVKWNGDITGKSIADLLKNTIFLVKVDDENGNSSQKEFPLQANSLHQFIEHYLTQVTQSPNKVWLSSNQENMMGVLTQNTNKSDDETHIKSWQTFGLAVEEAIQTSGEELSIPNFISAIQSSLEIKITETKSINFKCSCSKENCENAILNLGAGKIEELMAKQGRVTIKCDYCNTSFTSNKEDLSRLHQIASSKKQTPEEEGITT